MDDLGEIFKRIVSNAKTQDQKEAALRVLDEFIEQIDKAQKEFNDLNDVFSLVLESLPHAIWVINEDGSYFYYNSYAKEIAKILELCAGDFTELEVVFGKENYLMQKNNKNGKTLITATNITNEKQKQRFASMGQVSAHLAHEIRNPIGAINLLVSSLSKSIDSKNMIYMLEIRKALWRVERLIENTLLYSKGIKASIQSKNSAIVKKSIEDSMAYCEHSKHINFIYEIQDCEIVCDCELLELLLQNLILNAIESIEECDELNEGEICAEFYIEGTKQIIKIYDNGAVAQDEEHLFEAFRSTKIKGTGLGLALCKQIAQAHNGTISYHNFPSKHFLVVFENPRI